MQLLTTILDWCFPPRPEQLRVRALTVDTLTLTPHTLAVDTVGLLPFHDSNVRALIHEAKFYYSPQAQHIIGSLVAPYIVKQYGEAVIVPVPLHRARERERGFNQVTSCLRTEPAIAALLKTNILRRTKATVSQTTLSVSDRQTNVADAFFVPPARRHDIPPEKRILLVDDVYTTGATLHAAKAALRTAFPYHSISCLTFAHA